MIRKVVEEADPFLTVIGPHWLSLSAEKGGRRINQLDDWVAEELRIALQREIPIIPVHIPASADADADTAPAMVAYLIVTWIRHLFLMSDCHLHFGQRGTFVSSVQAKAAEIIKPDDGCPMRAGGRRRSGSSNGVTRLDSTYQDASALLDRALRELGKPPRPPGKILISSSC